MVGQYSETGLQVDSFEQWAPKFELQDTPQKIYPTSKFSCPNIPLSMQFVNLEWKTRSMAVV